MMRIEEINSIVENFLVEKEVRSENANIRDSIALLNTRLGSDNNIRYAVANSPAGKYHLSGEIYLHNLTESLFLPHCISYDLLQLISEGFQGIHVKSKPPKRFSALLGQCLSLLSNAGTLSSGAQSLSYLPLYAAPFLYYIKYTEEEVYQALEEFVYALNSAVMRASFQSLFVNITLNFDIPKEMKDVPVIWNGETQKETYGEFQEELDRFNYHYLKLMRAGFADGSPFTFPILTIYTNDAVFEKDEKYPVREELWKLTAKYSLPNFTSRRGNKDKFSKQSLCCHLSIDAEEIYRSFSGAGIWDLSAGFLGTVGGVQVVTINIAMGALLHPNDFDDWLTEILAASNDHINFCRNCIDRARRAGLLPVLDYYIGDLRKSFFNIIGVAGFNEATKFLFGEGLTSTESQKWTLEKLALIRDWISEHTADGFLKGLEAPPIENAKGFLARKIRERFPDVELPGGKTPYLTPGCNFPLEAENLTEEIIWRSKSDPYFNSGNIHFSNIFERITPEIAKRYIDRLTKRTDIGYEAINASLCICKEHGIFYGRIEKCPKCNKTLRRFTRVVGYFVDLNNFSPHNKQNFLDRRNYELNKVI